MIKRTFDVLMALFGLLVVGWLIVVLIFLARIDTQGSGIFRQQRIGRYGKPFWINKIRTMHATSGDISKFGRLVRKYKLDELPQLTNILIGEMSFVGPRPDIPGYYDRLEGENRKILLLRPGLCSRAALQFIREEEILAQQAEPLHYNDKVLFPEKVRLNLEYYYKQSLREDFKILWATFLALVRVDPSKEKKDETIE